MPGEAMPSPADDLPPQRAAVVPRAHRRGCEASLPLAELLLPVIPSMNKGIILVTAPPGGGITTALAHLRAVFPADLRVQIFDSNKFGPARNEARDCPVVLGATAPFSDEHCLEHFSLSAWTLDDCIEYLVARHPQHCRSVIVRLKEDQTFGTLKGSPQLLTTVMSAMAGNASHIESRQILRDHLRRIIPPGSVRDRLIIDGPLHAELKNDQWTWWRHDVLQEICTADWIVEQLCNENIPFHLNRIDDFTHLIPAIAATIGSQPAAADFMSRFMQANKRAEAIPMIASVLLSADPNWRPADGRELNLSRAFLYGANWSGIDLSCALLMNTNLTGADLSNARLDVANADGANLSHANLTGASMAKARLISANLSSANLTGTTASDANFSEANLQSANATNAVFRGAAFDRTDFAHFRGRSVDFSMAQITGAVFDGAAFAHADFTMANLNRVDLSNAAWSRTRFSKAILKQCNLEYLEMPGADFTAADLTGCLFTGSQMPWAKFTGANLRRTGLADVHWENADLGGADLTHASFHMGSSRSGLVGSTIAGEGSRTGFYTDDFNDQTFKPPEEIRKACLCGANLLGAKVERTDFYLVDLRRAVYSGAQCAHFRKTGAILLADDFDAPDDE